MDSTVRHVELSVVYEGKDISAQIWPYITSFRYTDKTDKDAVDDISISLEDTAGLWSRGWFPEQGAKFAAVIRTRNWFKPGDDYKRDCGTFEIDDISSSAPPSVFTISAVSVGISSSIRRQEKDKAWENITAQSIASEIAKNNEFKLFFDSGYDPTLERMDQKSESDLAFLRRVCDYCGLMLKITSDTIVVYQEEMYDAKEPVLTITRGMDGYTGHSFNANSADIYTACKVDYYDPQKKEMISYIYKPEGISGTRHSKAGAMKKQAHGKAGGGGGGTARRTEAPQIDPVTRMVIPAKGTAGSSMTKEKEHQIPEPKIGKVLKINRRCSSLAEAEQLAKASLRNKNMRQIKGSIKFMGHPLLYSGCNVAVSGFGVWDAAIWAVEEVTHNYSKLSGYATDMSIRGVLGY